MCDCGDFSDPENPMKNLNVRRTMVVGQNYALVRDR